MPLLFNYILLALFAIVEASPASYYRQRAETLLRIFSPVAELLLTAQLSRLTTEERDELFSLHEKLVDISSITGDEAEVSEFVEEYLGDLGYYVETVEVEEGRHNVFSYPKELKDNGAWPETLITSHIDTVHTSV
jgi:acetylornithine deacetylase